MSSSGETFNRTFKGGLADRNRDRSVRESRHSLERQAIPAYTVFNLHRFPLLVSLGDIGYIRVPARRADEPYGQTVIATPRFTMRDLGDNNFSAEAVFPELLAQEVVREYGETGGVFLAAGRGAPANEQIAAAQEAQLAWYRREYRKAVDAWYRYHQHKFITDRQRDAARELARRQEIPALPEWVDATQETAHQKICPQCGEAIKAAARICRYCRSTQAAGDAPNGATAGAGGAGDGGAASPPALDPPAPDGEREKGGPSGRGQRKATVKNLDTRRTESPRRSAETGRPQADGVAVSTDRGSQHPHAGAARDRPGRFPAATPGTEARSAADAAAAPNAGGGESHG